MKCINCGTEYDEGNAYHCDQCYHCSDCGCEDVKQLRIYLRTTVLCQSCQKARAEFDVKHFDGDTSDTDECTCPHCGYAKSDSWECSEGGYECSWCGRSYDMIRNVYVTYTTTPL